MLKEPDGVVGVLLRARSIIAEEKNWTKGCYARTGSGDEISPHLASASSFCALGAIRRAAGENTQCHGAAAHRALHGAALQLYFTRIGTSVPEFNDHNSTRHADVLEVFDHAIAAEMAKVK